VSIANSTPFDLETQLRAIFSQAKHEKAQHVFTQSFEPQALQRARELAHTPTKGGLHGWPISVKDNLDVRGWTTMAGTLVCADEPVAERDATVVQRLLDAGAVIVGKTNMSEFAFSGVGINPHYGTPRNPCDDKLARVPGGSSSGAAVSVALGLARAALGTDTGGSIRIPAALCGLVGFKATQSRVPLQGVMELSRSLDTVGVIAHNVRDCLQVDAVISGQHLTTPLRSLQGVRFAVPRTLLLDDMEPAVAQAFERSLSRLSAAGAQVVEIAFAELAEIAERSLPGGFSPVEGYAAHHRRLERAPQSIDPRVAARMALGRGVSALDYIALHDKRREWIVQAHAVLAGFDAMLSPTVPLIAPEIAPLLESDEAFFKVNRLLLRNPAVINYLDGCAFSLPCHAQDALPVGLMVSAVGGRDAELAGLALEIEKTLRMRN
jgi:aspartyl-tRNA(Asn)/glutamyl-tRNA(Gln) amidotransferase subunit A